MILNKNAEKLLKSRFSSKLPLLANCKELVAFTLAEVLITLLIIGIVASLVIPALIADTQKQEDYTRLLKAVSVVQNAANLIRVENGGRMAGLTNTHLDMANLFAPKMNYIKFCKDESDSPNCYISNSADIYNLQGNPVADESPYYYRIYPKIVTSDGFIYTFQLLSSTCQATHYIVNGDPKSCAAVFVDVNGVKPPNTWGKDIFIIIINDNNTIVYGNSGGVDPSLHCQLPSTNKWNGDACAGRAIIEGGIKYY